MASRDLQDADQSLAAAFLKVQSLFEETFPHFELKPTCTYRSVDEQKALFALGRTRCDGVTNPSKHNVLPSKAIDVGIFRRNPKGIPSAYIDDLVAAKKFDPDFAMSLYWNVGQLVQRFGFRSGGDWNGNGLPVGPDPNESLNDPYHMEIVE